MKQKDDKLVNPDDWKLCETVIRCYYGQIVTAMGQAMDSCKDGKLSLAVCHMTKVKLLSERSRDYVQSFLNK